MNRTSSDAPRSPYYPPRARWFSRLWYAWHHLRLISFLRQIPPRGDILLAQFLAAALLPGHVLRFYRHPRLATALTAAFFAALLLFFAAYGHLASNLAYGLMISAHAASLALLLQRWLQPVDIKGRLALAVLSLLVVAVFLYLPLRRSMLAHFFPLDSGHGIVIVRRGPPPASLAAGQMIVFELRPESLDGELVLRAGFGIEPVLALPGDRVEFTGDGLLINGVSQPALTNMPVSGVAIVPENHFFVWPRLAITSHYQPAGALSSGRLKLSMIAREQILGRPCQRWFGRRLPQP